jgi:uncharacterized membrane protein
MQLIPDWAPNVHPMIVHFPIALIFIALIFDFGSLIPKNRHWLRYSAITLYVFGALAAIAGYISGQQAAESVTLPALANPVLNEHADLALITVWFFGVHGLLRLFMLWKKFDQKRLITIVLFIVSVVGAGFLFATAEKGAELVYRFGVGTSNAKTGESKISPSAKSLEQFAGGIEQNENGSWSWDVEQNPVPILENQFHWIQGNISTIQAGMVNDSIQGNVLALNPLQSNVFITAGDMISDVQVDVQLNLDKFSGKIMVVHHVIDGQNYDFVALDSDEILLGRSQQGKLIVFDQAEIKINGRFRNSFLGLCE